MAMNVDIKKAARADFRNLVPFSFKKIGADYLLVADTGRYVFLGESQFKTLMEGGAAADPALEQFLIDNYMVLTPGSADVIATDKHRQLAAQAERTSLHIFVVTGRCNLSCLYCQASAFGSAPWTLCFSPRLRGSPWNSRGASPC